MTGQQLRNSILQEAIQGRLVPHNQSDESAEMLLSRIRKQRIELAKVGKIKKKDLDSEPISAEEIPFEIPRGWAFARLSEISLDSADGPFGSNLKKEHYTDQKQVRIIQLSNIGELGWKDTNVKYTTAAVLFSASITSWTFVHVSEKSSLSTLTPFEVVDSCAVAASPDEPLLSTILDFNTKKTAIRAINTTISTIRIIMLVVSFFLRLAGALPRPPLRLPAPSRLGAGREGRTGRSRTSSS